MGRFSRLTDRAIFAARQHRSLNLAGLGTGDPYFANVKSMLPMTGANNGTTFTDAVSGVIWTPNGNAKTDTSQSQFDGSSGYFDGTGDYLSTTTTAIGTDVFTLEGWMRFEGPTGSSAYYYAVNIGSANPQVFLRFGDGGYSHRLQFCVGSDPSNMYTTTLTKTDFLNVWKHWAITRDGNGSCKLWIAGQEKGVMNSNAVNLTATIMAIGANGAGGNGFLGHLQYSRYTKGIARYTADFTPPAFPFPLY